MVGEQTIARREREKERERERERQKGPKHIGKHSQVSEMLGLLEFLL